MSVKFEPDRTKGEEGMHAPDKDFSNNFAMTFCFDLETWFNVTAHPLLKGTLWVKYERDWAKGREEIFRIRHLGRTDGGWTDGRTD